ncbi:filamentous hemagglutinin N-terminal domain-containing protein [Rhizobium sp. AN63]|uniref:filamentous hemagglutinin N-terminal domain-containing protein n=1 Tax=Rhizobium sp. AN63 TaxID=3035210 RepID=UPI0027D4121E|nr:filamentous hemagglutinin N-terminal domain-containing protein [Rhizobium sp. AN63]MDQ4405114.1 filamentous hemagglutinin N-terminal domain-containing protein [Rhizobium sp. AN63]
MTSQFKRLPRKTTDLALFANAGTLAQKIIATVVSFTLVLQPVLLHAQDISPEAGGSFANRPGIGAAPNGVPLIDIVGPNSQGLSHNKYNNFNVGTPGVILNNYNGEIGTSKLGGATPGNPNLQGRGAATVILNEVTSQNRSSLVGPTEVFGGRADVIIANPNGTTCDGCGFINTPRATLTTGVPDIGADGRLNGFTVNSGDVTFGPKGANFATGDGRVDLFDIVSRTIQIDGTIYGEDLRLTAGKSKFDYATGEATPLDAISGTPEYAIDGSALGAMQAGRIKMVVTEKGAGVRMRGDMAANAGELSLSADGKISIGNASGNNGVNISSKGSVSAGRLTSKKSVSVKTGKDAKIASIGAEEDILINGGAGFVDVSGTLGASGALHVLADGRIALADASAAGPVSLWSGAGSIAIGGTAQSGKAMSLTAASGAIAAGSLLSKGDLALLSGLDLGISGLVLAEGNLQALAGSDIRYDSLEANGDVLLSSTNGVISFDKRTAAGGDIRIRQQNADLSNNRSGLATSGTLYIDANNINLTNSTLTSGGIDLTSSGTTDLTGARLNAVTASSTARSVQGSGDIAIQAGSLTANDVTNILAAHNLTLSLSQLANAGQSGCWQ